MKFSEKTRRLVLIRAKGRCEICGISCLNGQIHHRRPRGMGGTKRKETGMASNAALLHPSCHERVERNREEAIERGWLVPQYLESREVPFKRHDGWYLFLDDGTLEPFSSGTLSGE